MLLVSDVSLNELECKHVLNNSAKTELINWCLRLSSETPDLMLYGWIRCSDLIIYITFLYMKKKENLAPISYSVLIPLSSCGSERKPGCRGALSTPLPSQHALVERRREWDRRSAFLFADNPSTDRVPLQSAGESTCHPLLQRDCERPWLLNETWNGSLEMDLLWFRPSTQWQMNRMLIPQAAPQSCAAHCRPSQSVSRWVGKDSSLTCWEFTWFWGWGCVGDICEALQGLSAGGLQLQPSCAQECPAQPRSSEPAQSSPALSTLQDKGLMSRKVFEAKCYNFIKILEFTCLLMLKY